MHADGYLIVLDSSQSQNPCKNLQEPERLVQKSMISAQMVVSLVDVLLHQGKNVRKKPALDWFTPVGYIEYAVHI
jgi:hypothetical protein